MKLCQSKQADLLFSVSVRLSVHYSVPITNKVQYLKFRWGQKEMWVYFHMLKKIRVGWSAFLSPGNALLWGYSNAAVVPCVRVLGSVRPCVDLVNTIETTSLRVSMSNLSDMLTMMRGWTLLILEVKVTMDIYGNKLVNMIETKPFCISLSNLADMLTMVRGWTLLILEVRGQRSRSQWTYMEISLWTR